MIYGLYLSASGVIANSYRQDVLANNLANSETVGFKRDLALFRQRPTAAKELNGAQQWSDPRLEALGGGLLAEPTMVDYSQGEMEQTGGKLDVAIDGKGYFQVDNGRKKFLTRDGRFAISPEGELRLANDRGEKVLDATGATIHLSTSAETNIAQDGVVTQDGKAVARLAVFDVADPSKLLKQGGNLLSFDDAGALQATDASLRSQFVERANVDPTLELAELMDTQRQLEANANMIRYQDSTLQRLVNDVARIS